MAIIEIAVEHRIGTRSNQHKSATNHVFLLLLFIPTAKYIRLWYNKWFWHINYRNQFASLYAAENNNDVFIYRACEDSIWRSLNSSEQALHQQQLQRVWKAYFSAHDFIILVNRKTMKELMKWEANKS